MNKDLLINLRKELHRAPELSNGEEKTSARLVEFLNEHAQPDAIHTGVGGTGIIAVYDSGNPGATVMFRGEMDALPIQEVNTFDHRSTTDNVGHLCGHDGHSTIIAGLAIEVSKNKPKSGKVLILFQPAEETGEGAARMVESEIYNKLDPDFVFGLHNLPGYPMHQVVLRKEVFASASIGMIIELVGHSSHAAEPENGNSPAIPLTEIVRKVKAIPEDEKDRLTNFCLITPIHFRLGEQAFGTTPGEGVAMFTLRSFRNVDMDHMKECAVSIANKIAQQNQLEINISWTESFPTTRSSDNEVDLVETVAKELGINIHHKEEPFRWSEDFGVFSHQAKGCFFGLGSGKEQPALHNPDYDFPDELIETGVKLFDAIRRKIFEKDYVQHSA